MLIEKTIRQFKLSYMVTYLCKLAQVSRSGYYAWLNADQVRTQSNENDMKDYELIKEIFEKKNGKAGALQIKMVLENDYYVTMNHKKIRRIMRKFNLVTKVRQAQPYRKIAQATHEHKTCSNILNRQFDQGEPGKVLLTDITYLYYGVGQLAYLSCVKDGATREIVAHYISNSLRMDLVYRTLDRLFESLNVYVHPEGVLHSDQGVHYTHPVFQRKVKEMGFTQSMSRKANCWDNAPMESFFGHMKDELDYSKSMDFNELKYKVNNYIDEYNNKRYQWGLQKMTPDQYKGHLLAA